MRLDKITRRTVSDILELANAFFGPSGMAMTKAEDRQGCVAFAGCGGAVKVCVDEDERRAIRVLHIHAYHLTKPACVFFRTV